ncbi:site-specific integrase [Leptobacterium sp. I13]|uniref:site-specific integrase n=1 Tax=Leptobacterium meishanense TaxID=3128904 RepID=UPI0030EC348E
MNHNKLSILFLLQKVKLNKQGRCPIRCRITFRKKRKEFSTGLFINPDYWNSKKQKAHPPNADNDFTNTQISLIRQKLNQAFLVLQVKGEPFTVEDVYFQYKGKTLKRELGTVEYFEQFLKKFQKLVGVEIKQATWNKFSYIKSDAVAFIKWKYQRNDVLLKNLDMAFLLDFEYYLKTEKSKKQVTINKNLQRFKKVVKSAVTNKHLEQFPFTEHRPKQVKTNVVYLTTEELKVLENYNFSQPRLQRVRDMFVFCCYTGLAYHEMVNLQSKHIIVGFDGNRWIQMIREKTQKQIAIPLLSKALSILAQYHENDRYIFPKISNQKFNSYIKEIAAIVGIEKNLTHHIARKTFATTVLLYNDVPMEIVSELLGHSKISITQDHYAKVVQKKVSEHIELLKSKLEK